MVAWFGFDLFYVLCTLNNVGKLTSDRALPKSDATVVSKNPKVVSWDNTLKLLTNDPLWIMCAYRM